MEDDRHPSRREFLFGTVGISTLVASVLGEASAAQVQPPAGAAAPSAPTVPLRIGEVVSENGKLHAVISIKNANRTLPVDPGAGSASGKVRMLRYFEGKNAAGKLVWPPPAPAGDPPPPPLPGPTLRARVGDQVEITYLNHVDPSQLGVDFDRVEQGLSGCNSVTTDQGARIYPDQAKDAAPNCFHGSSTSNLHFHGTHVTPDGLGDNVLLQLRPDARVTEASVQADFAAIFAAGSPSRWNELPKHWQQRQLDLLARYDKEAPWRGARGLPTDNQLLPPTRVRIEAGQWPQYQIGAYPFCFKLTEYHEDSQHNPAHYRAGQCPGTHWYHAHKHGSTAINVYNGLAGVFIIEGGYDDDLRKIDARLKDTEKVFIVQNFSDAPNLLRQLPDGQNNPNPRGPAALWVNGQMNPTITMRPGEVQLWRFVNASVRGVTTVNGFTQVNGSRPDLRQIAQDGVQFCRENYKAQPTMLRNNAFAPGNRMDFLVQAPQESATPFTFTVNDLARGDQTLLTLEVRGPAIDPPMQFPTDANFPVFPPFLTDLPASDVHIVRTLDFGWEMNRSAPGRTNGAAPDFTINHHRFGGDRYDQTMVLDDIEEWILVNSTTTIAHPFHIHVNPFQVIEVYDPTVGKQPPQEKNFVWQDVIAIPPRATDVNTQKEENGYVRIRHRFVDFPGSYVLHCHMLAHEDRGMMQLVRVIPGNSGVPHH